MLEFLGEHAHLNSRAHTQGPLSLGLSKRTPRARVLLDRDPDPDPDTDADRHLRYCTERGASICRRG